MSFCTHQAKTIAFHFAKSIPNWEMRTIKLHESRCNSSRYGNMVISSIAHIIYRIFYFKRVQKSSRVGVRPRAEKREHLLNGVEIDAMSIQFFGFSKDRWRKQWIYTVTSSTKRYIYDRIMINNFVYPTKIQSRSHCEYKLIYNRCLLPFLKVWLEQCCTTYWKNL